MWWIVSSHSVLIVVIALLLVGMARMNLRNLRERYRWQGEVEQQLEALRSDIKDLRRVKPLVRIEEDEYGNERTVYNCF